MIVILTAPLLLHLLSFRRSSLHDDSQAAIFGQLPGVIPAERNHTPSTARNVERARGRFNKLLVFGKSVARAPERRALPALVCQTGKKKTHRWAKVARSKRKTPGKLKRVRTCTGGGSHINDRNLLNSYCRERLIKETGVRMEFTGYGIDASVCVNKYNCPSIRNVLLHGEQRS